MQKVWKASGTWFPSAPRSILSTSHNIQTIQASRKPGDQTSREVGRKEKLLDMDMALIAWTD